MIFKDTKTDKRIKDTLFKSKSRTHIDNNTFYVIGKVILPKKDLKIVLREGSSYMGW
jgi:hypothetical protein